MIKAWLEKLSFTGLNKTLEVFLQNRGFRLPQLIDLCRVLIWLAATTVVLGLCLLPWARWPLWLGFGAALSAWNLYNLAFFVQNIFPQSGMNAALQKNLVVGQLFRSGIRLFITGILLYAALTLGAANPAALLVGLSATVLTAPFVLMRGQQGRG